MKSQAPGRSGTCMGSTIPRESGPRALYSSDVATAARRQAPGGARVRSDTARAMHRDSSPVGEARRRLVLRRVFDMRSTIALRHAGLDDLATVAAAANVVWRQHYPGILTDAQIDYMLA